MSSVAAMNLTVRVALCDEAWSSFEASRKRSAPGFPYRLADMDYLFATASRRAACMGG